MNFDPEKIWYSKNLFSTILLPLSWLFRVVATSRKIYYRLRNSKLNPPETFVIVVGNITVGGTGKTPFVIWLAQQCKNKGLRVGVIARGYKRRNEQQIIEVNSHSLPEEVGDEALLLAEKTTCPVIVATERSQAVGLLTSKYEIDVVIADDGLQHYKLPRNFEIAVVDAERKFGNGRYLPAGPLRESIARLKSCDLVVNNGNDDSNQYSFEIKYDNAVSLFSDSVCRPLGDFKSSTVHAVAGIGNPARFFKILHAAGMRIIEHRFPDHHAYQEADLEFNGNDVVLMTEKDAVKCKKFISKDIWYLPISLSPNNALKERVSTLIEGISNG